MTDTNCNLPAPTEASPTPALPASVREPASSSDHNRSGIHGTAVAAASSSGDDQPTLDPRGTNVVTGPSSRTNHTCNDTHCCAVGAGPNLPSIHWTGDAHGRIDAGEPPTGPDQASNEPHASPVGSGFNSPDAATTRAATPNEVSSRRLADDLLGLYADLFDDAERSRIAAENRLRTLTDMGEWGKAVNPALPDIQVLVAHVDQLQALEHGAELMLKRAVRAHYLSGWIKSTIGIGEKQGARLIAAIGDPAWNAADGRPRRGPAELWAYCGLHVVGGQAPKRRKGVKANWSTEAKTRAYLCATSCIKQSRSPYREVYDQRRARTAETHADWTDGHSHNDALRIVSKAIVKDLWRAARAAAADDTNEQEAA